MILLGIDTSTNACSVSLMEEDKLLGEIILNHKKTHSKKLMPSIEFLLNSVELKVDDIDAIAVSIGPGSFTGLRIGLSTAKALCQAKNKKLIKIDTLDSLAYNAIEDNCIIIPLLDAQRDNLYSKYFEVKEGKLNELTDTKVENINEIIEFIKTSDKRCILLGEGYLKHKEKFDEIDNIIKKTSNNNVLRASSMFDIAKEKYNKEEFENYYTLTPVYIRKSQAEVQYEERKNKL